MGVTSPQEAWNLVHTNKTEALKTRQISGYFTWGEVFKNCTPKEIQAAPLSVYTNALKQSQLMERIRAHFNKPVVVHCWYRSPAHNKKVGGKPHSYHLRGLATDFHVQGFESTAGNRQVQNTLNAQPWMQKSGLEYTRGGWTHTDFRGYRARFFL